MFYILKRLGILGAVFVVALLVFSKTLNHEPKDMTADMEAAGLPVVYMLQDTTYLSKLHGYVDKMDATTMGENVTMVPSDNVLDVMIDTYGNEIQTLFYEVRSGDGQRLVEEGQLMGLTVEGTTATASLELEDLLALESEYLLVLTVNPETSPLYYYTKMVKYQGFDTDQCMQFVMDFHNKTLDREASSQLSMFLEPTSEADNTTLQHVTIHNRLRQIAWGQLEVVELTPPILTVQEANEDYNVIKLTSTVSAPGEDGSTDYYNVQEYYRVRQGIERMYLLDYERYTEEIFQGAEDAVSGNRLLMGIRSQDVDYWSNETGTNVCFVQQGDLWSYHQATNQLVQVYSFRSGSKVDVRENYDGHNIRIIAGSESGSINFIVYGYMNRGDHEGQVGISVCHYDSVTNTVEERLFLPAQVSYEVLDQSLSQLLYINDKGIFYVMLGDAIYAIDLDSKKHEVLLDNLVDGSCQVSADGRYVAWVPGEQQNTSAAMEIMDLNTGETLTLEAPEGSCLKPLGFMEQDCIVGYSTQSGGGVFMTTSIAIGAFDGTKVEILTTYDRPGYWITDVDVDGAMVKLSLARMGEIDVTYTDSITNKEIQDSHQAQVEFYTTEIKQTQVRLSLSKEHVPDRAPVLKTPELLLSEDPTTLKLDASVFYSF